jgi:hypothetical protein
MNSKNHSVVARLLMCMTRVLLHTCRFYQVVENLQVYISNIDNRLLGGVPPLATVHQCHLERGLNVHRDVDCGT